MVDGIIADSTFYICFLDCIQRPEVLIKILENFKPHIPARVFKEVSQSKNAHHLLKKKDCLNIFDKLHLNLGEVLRPFVSESELEKGEHETIILAYVCNRMGFNFILILDEIDKRNLVKTIIPELESKMTGTVGFLGMCYYKYRIFNKEEVIGLIDQIGSSKFRVDRKVIAEVKQRIEKNE